MSAEILPAGSKEVGVIGLPAEIDDRTEKVRKVRDLIMSIHWRVQDLRVDYAYNRERGVMFVEKLHEPPINYKLDLLTKQVQELREHYGI